MRPTIENLEERHLFSSTIVPPVGTYKGTSVSMKGFSSRLVMTLGKPRAGGTIIGTFYYLNEFKYTMHLRVSSDNTFHGTIADGKLAGTLTHGVITTASHGTIIDLSGSYQLFSGQTIQDSGTFLTRS